ncbi:uncharacterized protein DS421_12g364790 [Arachis hypogaea]|nr:uncharacterized protein DS421_12g364790 [Arachis hypogaea]
MRLQFTPSPLPPTTPLPIRESLYSEAKLNPQTKTLGPPCNISAALLPPSVLSASSVAKPSLVAQRPPSPCPPSILHGFSVLLAWSSSPCRRSPSSPRSPFVSPSKVSVTAIFFSSCSCLSLLSPEPLFADFTSSIRQFFSSSVRVSFFSPHSLCLLIFNVKL